MLRYYNTIDTITLNFIVNVLPINSLPISFKTNFSFFFRILKILVPHNVTVPHYKHDMVPNIPIMLAIM